jgi:hypothetical protein
MIRIRSIKRTAFVFQPPPLVQISNSMEFDSNSTPPATVCEQSISHCPMTVTPQAPHPSCDGAKSSGAKSSSRARQDEAIGVCHLLRTVLLCFSRVCHRRAARWPSHAGFCPPPPPFSMNLHLLLPLHRNETQFPLLWLVTTSQWPPIKGLYRDAECVAWALQSLPLALKPTKNAIAHLSVFVVPALYDADNHTLSVHYFKKEWVHVPGNPDPIAHMSQSEEASAVFEQAAAPALAPTFGFGVVLTPIALHLNAVHH